MISVLVTDDPLDIPAEMERLVDGGVATFIGRVRADDGVTCLMLEHYPGATECALAAIAAEAVRRWGCSAIRIVHRIGAMAPGDAIVFAAAAAPHRAAALDACAYCIDRLKTDAPFWKRESTPEGHRWVEARERDAAAAERWTTHPPL